jgi:exodeoxyribonuclease X
LLRYIIKNFNKNFEELVELTKQPILYDKFYTGKYKFKDIKEVIIKDPDYIEFILENVDLEPDLKYSIEHHLQNLSEEPEYKFNIGKYKGMLVEDVAEIDMNYLSWAYHNMKMSKGMRKRIGEILNKM